MYNFTFAVQRKFENREDVPTGEIDLAKVSTPNWDKELESSRNSRSFVENDKFTGPSVVEGKYTEVLLHPVIGVFCLFVCFVLSSFFLSVMLISRASMTVNDLIQR